MKKYLLFTMLALTVLAACKKGVDPAPGQRPEERVAATLSSYSTLLTGSSFGWKAILYPSGGGTYNFTMKFSTTNRVTMLSDINLTTSSTPFESSYKLRQQEGPSLLLDTYSYIHLLADPDPTANGGDAGFGSDSDFEFTFDSVVGDTIKLVGNRLGSKLNLIKAKSQVEYDSFASGYPKISQFRTYFTRTTIGGVSCEVTIDSRARTLALTYVSGTSLVMTPKSSFYIDGATSILYLTTPLVVGTTTINAINALSYDAATRTASGTINGTTVQIKEATAPLTYSTSAGRNLYNSGSIYVSYTGFTVDKVPDAYKVTTIPGYNFLVYYPKYYTSYDRLGFFVNNAYGAYGPAIAPSFPANGRIVYTNYGSFGTTPAAIAGIVTATTNAITSTSGFYVIQIGTGIYDLVNAGDARSWMRIQSIN